MSDGPTVTPAGSRPERDKPLCGGPRRQSEGHCTRPAGWGTKHPGFGRCKLHGGSTPSHTAAAAKAIASAAVVTYGLPREIDPRDALLEEVHRTAGAVAYLADRVRELDPAALIWGKTEESDQRATEFPGVNVKQEAKPNAWLVLYREERKHLVEVSRVAIAAGIEERRVRLAESMGAQLAAVLRAVLEGLGLSPSQWELVPNLVSQHVPALTGEAQS